jgi:hypothetical protein
MGQIYDPGFQAVWLLICNVSRGDGTSFDKNRLIVNSNSKEAGLIRSLVLESVRVL